MSILANAEEIERLYGVSFRAESEIGRAHV